MQTTNLSDMLTSYQLLSIHVMLEVAHYYARRIAFCAEIYAHQQRKRAERCEQLTERLRSLEVRA